MARRRRCCLSSICIQFRMRNRKMRVQNQGQQTQSTCSGRKHSLDPIRIQSSGLRIARKLIGGVREARSRMQPDVTPTKSYHHEKIKCEMLLMRWYLNVMKRCVSDPVLIFPILINCRLYEGRKLYQNIFAITCFAALFMLVPKGSQCAADTEASLLRRDIKMKAIRP